MQTKQPAKAGTKEWIALAVLALPTLLVSMDTTVIYLAVPSISAALKPTSAQQLWITDIYGFIEAGFLITMGTLGDRIGRRKLLLIGALAFAAASALAAYANTAWLLIAARALLGVAGATLLPSTLSLVRNMFHHEGQRAFAIGLWTTCFSTGTMLGPLVGGFLLGHFWWGSVFLMGVPVMVLFLILGPIFLPEYKDPGTTRFDLVSVLLLIVTILPVIFGLKQIAENGVELTFLLPIIIGIAFGIIFLRRQRKMTEPLIYLDLFKIPLFRVALVSLPILLFMWAGIFVYVGQYLQLVLGMTPLAAGLWTLPGAVVSTIVCATTDALTRVFPKPVLLVSGLVLMGISMLLFAQLDTGLPLMVAATVVLACGCAMSVTLSTNMVMTAAPPERAGAAAGISETSTALGASFGIALLGSIGVAVYRYKFYYLKIAGVPQTAIKTAKDTFAAAVQTAGKLPSDAGKALLNVARNSFLDSFRITAWVAAAILFVIAFVVARMLRRQRSEVG